MGILIGRKVYSTSRYVVVLLITIGIFLFFSSSVDNQEVKSINLFSSIFLLSSLFFNGTTSGLQARLNCKNGDEMMFYMNFYGMIVSFFVLVSTNQLVESLQFILTNHEILFDILIYVVCGFIGQFFIYKTIVESGALYCSIITTTRKVFSILLSVIYYHHSLNFIQYVAIFIIFGSLLIDIKFSENIKKPIKINV
jgi:solute carrier family 35 (UDP-galactose transporter), member B1